MDHPAGSRLRHLTLQPPAGTTVPTVPDRAPNPRYPGPIPTHVHGTPNGYRNWGCRCAACTQAAVTDHGQYQASRVRLPGDVLAEVRSIADEEGTTPPVVAERALRYWLRARARAEQRNTVKRARRHKEDQP